MAVQSTGTWERELTCAYNQPKVERRLTTERIPKVPIARLYCKKVKATTKLGYKG